MEHEIPPTTPILQVAWARFSELDANAIARSKANLSKRRWIAALGVLATLFAILSQIFPAETTKPALLGLSFRVLLILTPLVGSAMAAFTKMFYNNGDWLIMRAGAEEVLKEIYFYRTILQKRSTRRSYLQKRLTEIQRQLYRSMGGELVLKPYNGPVPSNYYPNDPSSDPGIEDLTGDDYFKYRLENQLAWHRKEVQEYQVERVKLQIIILASGVAGAFLAALGGILSLWVALTASLTAAFLGWQELRNIDSVVKNYSKVIVELSVIYDHWLNLETEERSNAEFYRMVRSTEEILWAQNVEYIKSQQEALKEADLDEEAGLINRVIKESVEIDKRTKQTMEETITSTVTEGVQDAQDKFEEALRTTISSLAEEASSELVQKELEAMSQATVNLARTATQKVSSVSSTIADIAKEFAHVDIGRHTTKEELNAILARYPKTSEPKG